MAADIYRLKRPTEAAFAPEAAAVYTGRSPDWLARPSRVPSDIWEVRRAGPPAKAGERGAGLPAIDQGHVLPLAA